jgi:hypothetical protein
MTAINFWIVFILCRRELTVALGARRGHGGEHESQPTYSRTENRLLTNANAQRVPNRYIRGWRLAERPKAISNVGRSIFIETEKWRFA